MQQLIKAPKVILMDLCGTLLDSLTIDRQVLDLIAEKYAGTSYAELRKKKDPTLSIRANFPIFFGEDAIPAFSEYTQLLIETLPQTSFFPGTLAFLQKAKQSGIALGVVTNRTKPYVGAALKTHNFSVFDNNVFSASEDLLAEKPSPEVIFGALEKMGLSHIRKKDVMFIGDSMVDVSCADRAECQAFVYTGNASEFEMKSIQKRAKDETKPNIGLFAAYENLEFLPSQNKKTLSVETNFARNFSGPKVTIIGAGGKVAKETIHQLYLCNRLNMDLALVSATPQKIEGALLDIRTALSIPSSERIFSITPPRIVAQSNEMKDVKGSDLILMMPGKWPTQEQKKEFASFDNTGRLAQSLVNHSMIRDLSQQIAAYAPEASVIMFTNQSDMMTNIARKELDPSKVLGFGGIIDSIRFCDYLAQELTGNPEPITVGKVQGHLVGYHNNDMILLSETLKSEIGTPTDTQIAEAVKKARGAGALISKLQKEEKYMELNMGPTVLPATALSSCVLAFTGQISPLENSFNVILPSSEIARNYGLMGGEALSVPIALGELSYAIMEKYKATEPEKDHLRLAQKNLDDDYEKMLEISAKRIQSQPRL